MKVSEKTFKIKEMLEVIKNSRIQRFRGDAENENKCYDYFQKMGCIFWGNMGDFNSSIHNIEIVLIKLLEKDG